MACQSAFSRRTEPEKECRIWRQAERNGPLGTKLRFVWQVFFFFLQGCISKVTGFSSEKAVQRVRQALIHGCGERGLCHSVNLADGSVPFLNKWMEIWSKAIFHKSLVITRTGFTQEKTIMKSKSNRIDGVLLFRIIPQGPKKIFFLKRC